MNNAYHKVTVITKSTSADEIQGLTVFCASNRVIYTSSISKVKSNFLGVNEFML